MTLVSVLELDLSASGDLETLLCAGMGFYLNFLDLNGCHWILPP